MEDAQATFVLVVRAACVEGACTDSLTGCGRLALRPTLVLVAGLFVPALCLDACGSSAETLQRRYGSERLDACVHSAELLAVWRCRGGAGAVLGRLWD